MLLQEAYKSLDKIKMQFLVDIFNHFKAYPFCLNNQIMKTKNWSRNVPHKKAREKGEKVQKEIPRDVITSYQ